MSFTTKELFKLWGHVAAHSFGGPAGQIAVIHKLVVEDKKIVSEEKFLNALNFCMLLPGPEAQQLATYMGWLMSKWRGGIIAGGLFILPGFLSILALSYIYVLFNDIKIVSGLFYGVKPAITAIVFAALIKIAKKSLNDRFLYFTALVAFISLFFFKLSFPLVIILAGFLGIIFGKSENTSSVDSETSKPSLQSTSKTVLVWSLIWFTPIILTLVIFGKNSNLHEVNIFFSKMSLVTFGGAYAALSYVAQQAVETYGWLQSTEMLDGLALAESTPGPLIQVVQYVGFMGGYRLSDGMNPYLSAFIASTLTTWMTFAPCFLFIFTLAPYIEYIRGKKILTNALKSISAAVVGVILNLSLWFLLNTVFKDFNTIDGYGFHFQIPYLISVDYYALIILLVSLLLQFAFQKSLFKILGVGILLGILKTLL